MKHIDRTPEVKAHADLIIANAAETRYQRLLRENGQLHELNHELRYENTTLREALSQAEQHRLEDIYHLQEQIAAKDAHATYLRAENERLWKLVVSLGGRP